MREWLKVIVNQLSMNFFLRNSKQARSFDNFKQILISKCTTKSACKRLWTLNFATNKIALLLELNQQVYNEKKALVAATGHTGYTSPKTKLKRIMLKIVKAYGNLLLLHNKTQCLEENNHLKTCP
jgi:hypothetical protein